MRPLPLSMLIQKELYSRHLRMLVRLTIYLLQLCHLHFNQIIQILNASITGFPWSHNIHRCPSSFDHQECRLHSRIQGRSGQYSTSLFPFLIFELSGGWKGKTRWITQVTRPLPRTGQCSSIHGYRWSDNWSLIFKLKYCFREAGHFSDGRGRTNVRSKILKCPHFTQITQRRYGHYCGRERERSRKIEEGSVKLIIESEMNS